MCIGSFDFTIIHFSIKYIQVSWWTYVNSCYLRRCKLHLFKCDRIKTLQKTVNNMSRDSKLVDYLLNWSQSGDRMIQSANASTFDATTFGTYYVVLVATTNSARLGKKRCFYEKKKLYSFPSNSSNL